MPRTRFSGNTHPYKTAFTFPYGDNRNNPCYLMSVNTAICKINAGYSRHADGKKGPTMHSFILRTLYLKYLIFG